MRVESALGDGGGGVPLSRSIRAAARRAAATNRLRANEGRPTPALFEVLPVFSSPCDLYSLAVLAVRQLARQFQLPRFPLLDETLSLARQVAHEHDSAKRGAPAHSISVFESDRRWLASLGPQRLIWEEVTPEQALDMIPLELWMNTLAMIVAMFPGIGPDSGTCADRARPRKQRCTACSTGPPRTCRPCSSARTQPQSVIDWLLAQSRDPFSDSRLRLGSGACAPPSRAGPANRRLPPQSKSFSNVRLEVTK